MSLPTADTPEYGYYIAKTANGYLVKLVGCDCLLAWLPVLNDFLIFKRLLPYGSKPLWVEQLTGGEPDSAGTHLLGGVFDLGYSDTRIAMVCREMGAPATWVRYIPRFEIDHTHGVLSGCKHNTLAAYQIKEQLAGGDGLVGTYPDPLPDPSVYRTWKQGIAYAKGVMSPTSFQLRSLKSGMTNDEVKKFQKWLWSKQPLAYKIWFKSHIYDFDSKGFTRLYGNATARMVSDTYKRLDSQYATGGWDYGVINGVYPDEPGTAFIRQFGGTVYI